MERRVTIGLPTYNRPGLLRIAIESLQAQTHRDIEILVSDNASTDPEVFKTVDRLAQADQRISYSRNPDNCGAAANFRSVLNRAVSPYFMWASDDDVWEPRFVERCLDILDKNPLAQMAFGTIDNIDANGNVVRTYEGFSRHTSTGDRRRDALRFANETEILGKANLVYGLYRSAAIREVVERYWDLIGFDRWGGDIVLAFAFLCRYQVVCSDEILLHKRVVAPADGSAHSADPDIYFIPPARFPSYLRRHTAVAPDMGIAAATATVLTRRLFVETFCALGRPAFWRKLARYVRRQ